VLAVLLALILAAPAHASGSGGALATPFTAKPAAVTQGTAVTFAFRAAPRTLARVDLIAPGQPAVRAKLGRVGRSGAMNKPWTVTAAPGTDTARLVLTRRGTTRYVRAPLTVLAPATLAAATSAIFPVQGPYSFGDRFGVGRPDHIHQGQDIPAAEGTPVVTPRAGTVYWVAYQAAGAGYYVVVAGDDGRDYVFMHLQAGSTAVAKGQPVLAGQRIGLVGHTGDAQGPHLHFEIWVNGWWASKASTPIDPLPELQAWAASSA
jgi:murein DD-endopeptidase MepM/ murein hydrolase activator NlpD